MAAFYVLLAAAAGAMLPMQAAVNARLARALGSSFWAAGLSGLVSALLLAVLALVARAPFRAVGLGAVPWWAWVGGTVGAVVLSAMAIIAPRLGTASLIALIMAGQVVGSLVLDTYGLLGLEAQPLSARRVAAAVLLLAGAALMR